MNFPPDFRDLLRLLDAHCVEYCVVGGYAVGRHGYPRFTADIDLLIRPESANAERLLEALDAFGFGSLGLVAEDFLGAGKVVQLGVRPLRIDLITSIDGVSNDEVFANLVRDARGEFPVNFIGIDQLLANKRATDRPKDAVDVQYLVEFLAKQSEDDGTT